MKTSKRTIVIVMLFISMSSIRCYPGDKGSLNVGILYNGLILQDYTSGIGTSLGFEYRPAVLKNVSYR